MKKICIIGANSSLARNFIYYIRSKDITCVLYDVQENCIDDTGFIYHQIDFKNQASIDEIDCSGEAVFIFAGLTGADKSNNNPNLFIDVNEKALVSVLERVRKTNPRCRVIYPSSRLVYADVAGALKETNPLEAKSIYALNKIFAENLLRIYHNIYGLNYTIFRIAIPFGVLNSNSTSYGIVSKFKEQANNGAISLFGDGTSVRTFTHIKNICEVLASYDNPKLNNDIFNIGGIPYSFNELAKAIQSIIKCDIIYIPWPTEYDNVEVKNGNLDYSKLKEILDIDYIDIMNEIK